MDATDTLQLEAEHVRASGILGKPGTLSRLFDFLLERSVAAETPKELEIAIQVFGKTSSFDVGQDSVVRVYVHKLRRRLDDLYERSGEPRSNRIVLPKGEYRLGVEQRTKMQAPAVAAPPRPWRKRLMIAAAVAGAFALGVALTSTFEHKRPDAQLEAVRSSAVWAPLLADDLPVTIVVGDYYLVGEADNGDHIRRLVRDFFINSPGDLLHQAEVSPDSVKNYRNLNLTYLPTGTAFALRDLMPVLSKKRVRVVLMSELNGSLLKGSHIVYVGYISGLGMLGDSVFAGSRLSPGGSYDELIDSANNKKYMSTANSSEDLHYTDYGYFSTFPGPDGNRIVIIAGTRDTGVTQIAEALTQPKALESLGERAAGSSAFESLYEVYGVARASTSSKQLFVSSLKTAHLWD
jgi:hypothetical protein